MTWTQNARKVFGLTPDNLYFWYGSVPGSGPANTSCDSAEPIVASDGRLYGVNRDGGTLHQGSIFSTSDLQTDYVILHEFSGGSEGFAPNALLQANDGNFYGTTTSGNATAFRLTPDGTFTILHTFGGAGDGVGPIGALIQATDGMLYGTTQSGASSDGTVFRMTLDGTVTVVHAFHSDDPGGYRPREGVVQASDGFLYGRTWVGQHASIYRMSLDGSAFTTLHTWSAGVGYCGALVEGPDHNIYGTVGGEPIADTFSIFRVTSAGQYTDLQFLPRSYRPSGPLVLGPDGAIYGTTPWAGEFYPGTVFRLVVQ